MILPSNGKILIIDDNWKEAYPLIQALSKDGISATYYSGDPNYLPDRPLPGVRIIFLDIELGTKAQPPKTKISTVIAILNRLINPQNGPCLILAWTKHENIVPELKRELENKLPVFILSVEKSSCKKTNSETSDFDTDKIIQNINSQLEKSEAFKIFIFWENFIQSAGIDIIRDFSSYCILTEDWNKEFCKIFHALSVAHAGDQLDIEKSNDVIKHALMTFNSAFLEVLDNKVFSYNFLTDIPNIKTIISDPAKPEEKIIIDEDTRSKINNLLLLSKNVNSTFVEPGNVYLCESSTFPLEINNIIKEELESFSNKEHFLVKSNR